MELNERTEPSAQPRAAVPLGALLAVRTHSGRGVGAAIGIWWYLELADRGAKQVSNAQKPPTLNSSPAPSIKSLTAVCFRHELSEMDTMAYGKKDCIY